MTTWALSSDKTIDELAARLRAVAHPARLAIVLALRDGPQHQAALHARLACSQPSVSLHIAKLQHHGWVTVRRKANREYVSLADHPLMPMLLAYCEDAEAALVPSGT